MNEVTDKDMGWDKLYTTFEAGEESAVFVGFLRSSGIHKGSDMTVAGIGAIHEFGAPGAGIPERSFMRSAIDANERPLASMIEKISGKVADGDLNLEQGLGTVGQFLRQKMQSKIRGGLEPPLSPKTIERKKSSKPLIDTGQLINSIDWEIVKGKEGSD